MKSIYLIYGEEPFLIEETKRKVVEQAIGEIDGLNYSSFDMEEEELTDAIRDAQTLPFMGGQRVVVIKNASFLTGAKTKKEQEVESLLRYIEEPNDMATLIITLTAAKLDARKKISKALNKSNEVETVVCQPLPHHKLRQWIQEEAKIDGAGIEPKAIERLILLMGSDLTGLKQEIQKLTLYTSGQLVTENHISSLVTSNVEQSIFMLIEKIIKKEKKKAHELLTDMLKKKEEPIKIIALLVRQVRLILIVGELTKKGMSTNQVAKELNMHPYPIQLAAENTTYYEKDRLISHLHRLITLDNLIKTGRSNKVLGLEQFIAEI